MRVDQGIAEIFFVETVCVLAITGALLALAASVIVRFVRTPVWRRLVWRIAVLALIAGCLAECTGIRRVSTGWWSGSRQIQGTGPALRACATTPRSKEFLKDLRDLNDPNDINGINGIKNDIRMIEDAGDPDQKLIKKPGFSENLKKPGFSEKAGLLRAVTEKAGLLSDGLLARVRSTNLPSRKTTYLKEEQLWKARLRDSIPVLACVWLGVSLVCIAWIVINRAALIWFRWRRLNPAPANIQIRANELVVGGFRKQITVGEVANLRVPVAFGIFWPTICVPARFQTDLEPTARDAVLIHELTHLAARDPIWFLAADFLIAILWWHPAIWWIRCQLRAESETAADQASAQMPGGPTALAAALVVFGKRLTLRQRLAWLTLANHRFRSSLGKRIAHLIRLEQIHSQHQASTGWLGMALQACLPCVLVFGILMGCAWARPGSTLIEGETTMTLLNTSWRQSLLAAALAAFVTADAPPATADDEPSLPRLSTGVEVPSDNPIVPAAFREEEAEKIEVQERRLRMESEAVEEEKRDVESEFRQKQERLARAIEDLKGKMQDEAVPEEHRQDIEREVHRLREEMEREEHRAQERFKAIQEKRDRLEREKHGLRERMMQSEAKQLRNALEQIERELGELGDSAPERSRELSEQRARIQARLAEMKQTQREHLLADQRGGLERMRQEIERLRAEGKMDRAERLERQVQAMEERIHGLKREESDRTRPERRIPGDELSRRVEHIRIAAENLHAAGLHDQAEAIMHQAEEIMRERRDRPREMRDMRPLPRDSEPAPPEHAERVEHLQQQLHELNKQMDQLREELGHIHKFMEEIAGRVERDRR